jgi:hypothetical protein
MYFRSQMFIYQRVYIYSNLPTNVLSCNVSSWLQGPSMAFFQGGINSENITAWLVDSVDLPSLQNLEEPDFLMLIKTYIRWQYALYFTWVEPPKPATSVDELKTVRWANRSGGRRVMNCGALLWCHFLPCGKTLLSSGMMGVHRRIHTYEKV